MKSTTVFALLCLVVVFVAAKETAKQPSDAELQGEDEKSTKEEIEECTKDLADFGDACEVLAIIEEALSANGTDTENVRRARAIIADIKSK
ncbi:hypothetical protein AAVH_35989 [Aphelenchoides avenae]|nr:hypothetical protein AAVH_35989 [Aphelenchus avenae]